MNSDRTTRRAVLGAAGLAAPLLAGSAAAQQQREERQQRQSARQAERREQRAAGGPVTAYVGSFTTANRQARGEGINVFRMDPASGAWTHVQTLGDLANPSFLVLSRDQRFLYSVHGDGDYATAFAIEADGKIRKLNQGATGGRNGVRQAIDPTGRWMVVANYASGSVAVLPVRPDGSLGDQQQLVQLPGNPGPHRTEQGSSHPHDAVFDPSGRFVVVPDKGVDRTFVFALDPATGQLTPAGDGGFVAARAGAGPRHVAFHPSQPVAWVLNELDSTTATYRWNPADGTLRPAQVIGTLPPDFTGNSTTSELAVSGDGRFLYASNRGHDSVVTYAAQPEGGLLSPVGWQPTQGKVPRFIGLAPGGRFLYAANEQGDTIVTFRVDARSGRLTPAGQVVACKSPVTIAFAGG